MQRTAPVPVADRAPYVTEQLVPAGTTGRSRVGSGRTQYAHTNAPCPTPPPSPNRHRLSAQPAADARSHAMDRPRPRSRRRPPPRTAATSLRYSDTERRGCSRARRTCVIASAISVAPTSAAANAVTTAPRERWDRVGIGAHPLDRDEHEHADEDREHVDPRQRRRRDDSAPLSARDVPARPGPAPRDTATVRRGRRPARPAPSRRRARTRAAAARRTSDRRREQTQHACPGHATRARSNASSPSAPSTGPTSNRPVSPPIDHPTASRTGNIGKKSSESYRLAGSPNAGSSRTRRRAIFGLQLVGARDRPPDGDVHGGIAVAQEMFGVERAREDEEDEHDPDGHERGPLVGVRAHPDGARRRSRQPRPRASRPLQPRSAGTSPRTKRASPRRRPSRTTTIAATSPATNHDGSEPARPSSRERWIGFRLRRSRCSSGAIDQHRALILAHGRDRARPRPQAPAPAPSRTTGVRRRRGGASTSSWRMCVLTASRVVTTGVSGNRFVTTSGASATTNRRRPWAFHGIGQGCAVCRRAPLPRVDTDIGAAPAAQRLRDPVVEQRRRPCSRDHDAGVGTDVVAHARATTAR